MTTIVLCVFTFGLGMLIGSKISKKDLVQIGGDNAYQIGIVNNSKDSNDEDDCARLPVW